MFEETYASVTTNVAGREIKLETGKIARQATASIIASSGDNQVLVTVVAGREPEGQSFFPLTVNYTEKYYAAGKIPGSFFRREGRPTEKETLVSILIYKHYLNGFPKCQTTRLYLVPAVTGLTLCHTNEGNTMIEPFGNISLHCILCFDSSRICGS